MIQQNQRNLGKGTPSSLLLLAALTLVAVAIATLATTIEVTNATTIDIPDPVLELEEEPVNATEDRQMIIRPDDIIPENGTRILPMTEADDVDFKGLVPAGVSVIVTNETVTVTNQPIDGQPGVASTTGPAAPAPTAATPPAPEAEEDTSSSDEDEE